MSGFHNSKIPAEHNESEPLPLYQEEILPKHFEQKRACEISTTYPSPIVVLRCDAVETFPLEKQREFSSTGVGVQKLALWFLMQPRFACFLRFVKTHLAKFQVVSLPES